MLGRTWKYRTSNLPNLQIPNLEPTEPLVCSWNRTSNLPNLLKTEPNLEPYYIQWEKIGDFFWGFSIKTEPRTYRTSSLSPKTEPRTYRTSKNRTEPRTEPGSTQHYFIYIDQKNKCILYFQKARNRPEARYKKARPARGPIHKSPSPPEARKTQARNITTTSWIGPIWNQSGREGFSLVTSASFCIEHLEPEER